MLQRNKEEFASKCECQLRNRPDLLAHVLDFLGYIAHRQDQLIVDCSFEENQGDEQVFALMSKRVQSKLMKRFDLVSYLKTVMIALKRIGSIHETKRKDADSISKRAIDSDFG